MGSIAYKLALSLGSQIYHVFSSLLTTRAWSTPLASPQLPPVSDTSTILPQPEAVLGWRVIRKGNYRLKSEISVKWVGASIEDATWENEWHFAKSYPDFILEDKDTASGRNDKCICAQYAWRLHASLASEEECKI